jgi:hypothetical protein
MDGTLGTIVSAVALILGMAIASAIDIALLGGVVAIPLAALVYLSVISQGTALAVITFVACIATMRVIIVSVLKVL